MAWYLVAPQATRNLQQCQELAQTFRVAIVNVLGLLGRIATKAQGLNVVNRIGAAQCQGDNVIGGKFFSRTTPKTLATKPRFQTAPLTGGEVTIAGARAAALVLKHTFFRIGLTPISGVLLKMLTPLRISSVSFSPLSIVDMLAFGAGLLPTFLVGCLPIPICYCNFLWVRTSPFGYACLFLFRVALISSPVAFASTLAVFLSIKPSCFPILFRVRRPARTLGSPDTFRVSLPLSAQLSFFAFFAISVLSALGVIGVKGFSDATSTAGFCAWYTHRVGPPQQVRPCPRLFQQRGGFALPYLSTEAAV